MELPSTIERKYAAEANRLRVALGPLASSMFSSINGLNRIIDSSRPRRRRRG